MKRTGKILAIQSSHSIPGYSAPHILTGVGGFFISLLGGIVLILRHSFFSFPSQQRHGGATVLHVFPQKIGTNGQYPTLPPPRVALYIYSPALGFFPVFQMGTSCSWSIHQKQIWRLKMLGSWIFYIIWEEMEEELVDSLEMTWELEEPD